jgi:DNA-directed RNA polymerase subunit RPC12/RpoP
MGDDLSRDLTSRMPIVPHSSIGGIDCCGCIIAALEGTSVELQCNECGAVVGVVQLDILKVLLGLECATATCPHCGKENTFPGFSKVSTYVCAECGKAVAAAGPEPLEWVEIHDDTCTWYEFDDGREPIAVMPCNRCGSHPDVDEDGVVCPLCRKRSPGRSDDLEELILAWNAMIDAGE